MYDEAEESDGTNGGGRVAMVVAGPNMKSGFQSATLYKHQNLLKMITSYLGIDGNLGLASTADPMSEFFK